MIATKVNSCCWIDIDNFDAASVLIEDVAAGLSKINRYHGATHTPYSVAQHCVELSYYGPSMHFAEVLNPYQTAIDDLSKACLMHDAPEYIIGDTTSPVKKLMLHRYGFDWDQHIELPLIQAIFERFSIPMDTLPIVYEYDKLICVSEMAQLFHDGQIPQHLMEYAQYPGIHITPWGAEFAEATFLTRFNELFGKKRTH